MKQKEKREDQGGSHFTHRRLRPTDQPGPAAIVKEVDF